MSKAPKYEAVTTPVGSAVFPWITKADTKFTPEGTYKVDLAIPEELATDIIHKLETIRDEFRATLTMAQQQALHPRPVYTMEMSRPVFPEDCSDEAKEEIKRNHVPEPTGNILLRWKLKATVGAGEHGDGFTQAPVVVSAATGEKIESPVYDGSMIRIKGHVVPYTNAAGGVVGVTLRMRAVQVVELVTGEGSGGDDTFWTSFDAT